MHVIFFVVVFLLQLIICRHPTTWWTCAALPLIIFRRELCFVRNPPVFRTVAVLRLVGQLWRLLFGLFALNTVCDTLTGWSCSGWLTACDNLWQGTYMSTDVKLTAQITSGWRPFLRQLVNNHVDWNAQLSINGYTQCLNKTAFFSYCLCHLCINVLHEYSGIFSFSFRFTAASALSFISEQ